MKIEAGKKYRIRVDAQLTHKKNEVVMNLEYVVKTKVEYPSKKALLEEFFEEWYEENRNKYTKLRTHTPLKKEDIRIQII